MTTQESDAIQGAALLRLNRAKKQEAWHRQRLEQMGQQLSQAGRALQSGHLQVEDGRLVENGILFIYPSVDLVSKAIQEHKDAAYEKEQAVLQCRELGLCE